MGVRKDFVWGAATSAYQIEGAVKEAGIAFYNDLIDELLNIAENHFKVILSNELILDYADGRFRMHFISQDKTSVSAGRSMRYVEVDEVKDLRILADRSSVEVFVNDGEYVFSTRYYPENHKLLAEAVEAQIRLSEIM